MRSMWRRRLVRSSRDTATARASEAPASFGFGWTSAAGRAVVVAISSPSSERRDLRRPDSSSARCAGSPRWRAWLCDRWYSRPRPFGGAWTEVHCPCEHRGWILGATAALAADRRMALAAVPGGDGDRRPHRGVAAAKRARRPVRASARHLL